MADYTKNSLHAFNFVKFSAHGDLPVLTFSADGAMYLKL